MLVTKQQLLAAIMASDDDTRYAISHLQVEPGPGPGNSTITSTNGHMLVTVTSRDLPAEDIPEPPRQHGTEPEAVTYLHAAPALDAAKTLPRKASRPGFQLGRMLVEGASGRVSIGASDGLTHQITIADQPLGIAYPAVQSLLRAQHQKTPVAKILLSAKYLKMIATYAQKFAALGSPAVKLTFYGHQDPVLFEWEDPRHVVEGLLMPMRIEQGPATDETVPGRERLEPETIEGVDDALAAAALNAREKANQANGKRAKRASNSDGPAPVST